MGLLDFLTGYTPPSYTTKDMAPVQPAEPANAVLPNVSLDYLNKNFGGYGTVPAAAADTPSTDYFSQFVSKVPGAQYLSQEERQGAIGLALLKAGAMGLQAAQGRAGQPAPTIGSTAGAIAGGLGEGLHGMSDTALKGAAIQAQMLGKQKTILEAQQLFKKQAAIDAFSKGDRSPEVLALINPDKAIEQMYKPDEHLASLGMMRGPDGAAVPIPGYNAALAQQSRAKATGQTVPIAPGGYAFSTPAPDDIPQAQGPQLSDVMTRNPNAIIAAGAAKKAGVDPNLFLSMLQAESGFNPQAVSPKGAQGLGQLMPATAKARGVTDPFNAQQNATASAEEFRSLQDKYGNPQLAVMAYNWGQGNLDNWLKSGADPKALPNETLSHVRKVFSTSQTAPAQPQGQAQSGYLYDGQGRFIGFKSPDTRGETTYDEKMGTHLAEQHIEVNKAAQEAQQKLGQYKALDALLQKTNTGKWSETALEVKRGLQTAGVDLGAIGWRDDIGQQEAARAMGNIMAINARAAGSGATSDRDMIVQINSVPGINATPQGRKLLIEAQQRLADRAEQVAQFTADYADSHGGRLDSRYMAARRKIEMQPVFDEGFRSKVNSIMGGGASGQTQGAPNLQQFWGRSR